MMRRGILPDLKHVRDLDYGYLLYYGILFGIVVGAALMVFLDV